MVESRCAITKGRASLHDFVERGVDLGFGDRIERAGRLIEIRIGGSFNSARAIDNRCRSPPDSMRPRSPALVRSPARARSMNSSACARAAAIRISSSWRPLATRRLSAIER